MCPTIAKSASTLRSRKATVPDTDSRPGSRRAYRRRSCALAVRSRTPSPSLSTVRPDVFWTRRNAADGATTACCSSVRRASIGDEPQVYRPWPSTATETTVSRPCRSYRAAEFPVSFSRTRAAFDAHRLATRDRLNRTPTTPVTIVVSRRCVVIGASMDCPSPRLDRGSVSRRLLPVLCSVRLSNDLCSTLLS